MDVIHTHADILTYFMSLIVVGTAIKYRFVPPSQKEPIILMGKKFGRNQVTGFAVIAFMGVVFQLVSDTVQNLQGNSLLQDPVMIGGFVTAFLVLATAKT